MQGRGSIGSSSKGFGLSSKGDLSRGLNAMVDLQRGRKNSEKNDVLGSR